MVAIAEGEVSRGIKQDTSTIWEGGARPKQVQKAFNFMKEQHSKAADKREWARTELLSTMPKVGRSFLTTFIRNGEVICGAY